MTDSDLDLRAEMDALINLVLPAGVPKPVAYFVLLMALLNLSAVVTWACCLVRGSRAAPEPRFKLKREE